MKIRAENSAAARARKVPASREKPGAVDMVAQGERNEHGERIEREADRQELAPDDISEQPFGGVRQEPVPGAGGRPR